jgi:rare lipoprotein A
VISRWHLRPYIRLVALCSVAVLAFTSCFSRPGGHAGYQKSAYNCRGQHYQPLSVEEALDFQETGGCSWYNESSWFGLKRGTTSLGEKVMPWHLTGAHKTLPLPCLVKVTNLDNGKTLKVRINDRGPFIPGRILDVTPRAAKKLGFYDQGITHAKIEVISIGDGSYKRKKRGWFF